MNAALVTRTMARAGAQAIEQPGALDLPAFFDFSSLCEATVILDTLEVMASADQLPALGLISALRGQGLLDDVQSRLDRDAVRRAVLRLPDDIARLVLPEFGGTAAPSLVDSGWSGRHLDDVGAIRTVDYDRGMQALVTQVEEAVSYPSLQDVDARQRL